jgi:hypothetical protein
MYTCHAEVLTFAEAMVSPCFGLFGPVKAKHSMRKMASILRSITKDTLIIFYCIHFFCLHSHPSTIFYVTSNNNYFHNTGNGVEKIMHIKHGHQEDVPHASTVI